MEKKYFFISSLAKGLAVLELLVEKGELSVSETARHMDINRASSHRFLSTLKELGYVRQSPTSAYVPTVKTFELGMEIVKKLEIKNIAQPFMDQLGACFGETINLGMWDGREVVHLHKVESREALHIDVSLGGRAPAYCTGLGKAILAHLPAAERLDYLGSTDLTAFTAKTITSRQKLQKELDAVQKKGLAVDKQELVTGLTCVAAPLLNHDGYPQYAISLSSLTQRMTRKNQRQIEAAIKKSAAEISAAMGCPSS